MPKAAKVTHPPRQRLNCECDPPLKPLLPPRAQKQCGRTRGPGGRLAAEAGLWPADCSYRLTTGEHAGPICYSTPAIAADQLLF
eukprot:743679-Prymnesium_polylepis.1